MKLPKTHNIYIEYGRWSFKPLSNNSWSLTLVLRSAIRYETFDIGEHLKDVLSFPHRDSPRIEDTRHFLELITVESVEIIDIS